MSDQPIKKFSSELQARSSKNAFFQPFSIASHWDPASLLKITLKYQALLCFERTLRFQESFNVGALSSKSVISLLKKPS